MHLRRQVYLDTPVPTLDAHEHVYQSSRQEMVWGWQLMDLTVWIKVYDGEEYLEIKNNKNTRYTRVYISEDTDIDRANLPLL